MNQTSNRSPLLSTTRWVRRFIHSEQVKKLPFLVEATTRLFTQSSTILPLEVTVSPCGVTGQHQSLWQTVWQEWRPDFGGYFGHWHTSVGHQGIQPTQDEFLNSSFPLPPDPKVRDSSPSCEKTAMQWLVECRYYYILFTNTLQGLILQLPICPAALMEVLASVILYVQIGSKQNTLNMYATSS